MHELIHKNILKYIDANDEEFLFFTSKLEKFHLKKKEKLIVAGENCKHLAFVNSGCLRAFISDEQGTEHIIQFAVENYWISDLYGFLTGNPAIYTIEAIENTDVLKISRDSLEDVFRRYPKFERFFRLLIERSHVNLQQRIISSLSDSAEKKYLNLFEKQAFLISRIPQKYLASYLGITAESLSRIKKKMFKKE